VGVVILDAERRTRPGPLQTRTRTAGRRRRGSGGDGGCPPLYAVARGGARVPRLHHVRHEATRRGVLIQRGGGQRRAPLWRRRRRPGTDANFPLQPNSSTFEVLRVMY
jgi:hypothetical protein